MYCNIEQKCKKRLNLMRAVTGSTWEANKKTQIFRAAVNVLSLNQAHFGVFSLQLIVMYVCMS